MYIFIFIILIIIILFIILFYKNSIEKFDIFGAEPRGLGWGLGTNNNNNNNSEDEEKICNPGFICNTENNFGLYDNNCNCVTINKNNSSESENCNPGFLCINENGIGLYNNNCKCIITNNKNNGNIISPNLPTLEDGCYPKNTNLDAICKLNNSKNGIKNIKYCNDKNTVRVECGLNYINGTFYDDSVLRTPCQNIKTDFDTWCKYYNSNIIPKGYNVNSIGSKKLLVGSNGGCYLNNGESDNSKAAAICDYNHMDEVKKLSPANPYIDYNIFTNCKPIRDTNFVRNCSQLLNVDYDKAYADQIMGYDCNPGFARAKCIKSEDMKIFNNRLFNGSYDRNNQPVEQIQGSCNCPSI
jgi:hypothetical protein